MGQLIAYHPDTGEERMVLEKEGMITAAPLKDGSAVVVSAAGNTEYQLSRVDSGGAEVFSREYTDQTLQGWSGARLVERPTMRRGRR